MMKRFKFVHGLVAVCTLTIISVLCMTSQTFATSHDLKGIRFATSDFGVSTSPEGFILSFPTGVSHPNLTRTSVYNDSANPFWNDIMAFHSKFVDGTCVVTDWDSRPYLYWGYRSYNSSNSDSLHLGFPYYASFIPDSYDSFAKFFLCLHI